MQSTIKAWRCTRSAFSSLTLRRTLRFLLSGAMPVDSPAHADARASAAIWTLRLARAGGSGRYAAQDTGTHRLLLSR